MLVLEKITKSIAAEQYRILRTNIQYTSIDNPIKVILVTSSDIGEGKSTTSSNLALSFLKDNKKTLLIDCDLRKPSIHKKFEITNSKGLSNLLITEKKEIDKFIQKHKSGLNIITSGTIPPNPSEILSSKAMENLIKELKKEYDYLIIDAPPVNVVADAKILSTKVDGTILVVKYGKCKKESLTLAIKSLKAVNANLIGTVFNGENKKCSGYQNYYKKY